MMDQGFQLSERDGGSVPERLAEAMARLIDTGQWAAGSRLAGERGLSEKFGVSRISVRQALKDLQLRGYVRSRPKSGWVVSSPEERELDGGLFRHHTKDARTIHQVMDLRQVLEPPIAARAAVRHFDRELAELESPLLESERELLSPTPRTGVFQRCDIEFHSAIAEIAHNPMLTQLVADTHEWTAATRQTTFQTPERTRSSVLAHRMIFAAIQARDPAAAQRAMAQHLSEVLGTIDPLTTPS